MCPEKEGFLVDPHKCSTISCFDDTFLWNIVNRHAVIQRTAGISTGGDRQLFSHMLRAGLPCTRLAVAGSHDSRLGLAADHAFRERPGLLQKEGFPIDPNKFSTIVCCNDTFSWNIVNGDTVIFGNIRIPRRRSVPTAATEVNDS